MVLFIRILSALSVAACIGANLLANLLPLGGVTTSEVAYRWDNLFIPAGFTFSIWGVIYLVLLVFSVRFFFSKPETVRRMGPWIIAANLLNGAWILAWHHLLPGLSVAIMLALLASLIGFYLATRNVTSDLPGGERLGKRLMASIYLGWITVATIANLSAWLSSIQWAGMGWGPEIWYAVVIAAAVLVNLLVLITRRDLAFAGVAVWACWGLYSRHHVPGEGSALVSLAPALAMGVLGLAMFITLIRVALKPHP